MFSTLIFRRIDPRRRAVLQFKIHRMLSVSGASDVTCCVSGSAMSLMSVPAIGAWHKRPGCPSWGKRVKTLLATSDLASQGKCVSVSCHWEKLSTLLRRMTYFYCWVKSGHNWERGRGILSEWTAAAVPALSTPGHWLGYSSLDSALTVFVFKSRVNVTSLGPSLPSPCLPQILSTSLDSQTSAIVRAGGCGGNWQTTFFSRSCVTRVGRGQAGHGGRAANQSWLHYCHAHTDC